VLNDDQKPWQSNASLLFCGVIKTKQQLAEKLKRKRIKTQRRKQEEAAHILLVLRWNAMECWPKKFSTSSFSKMHKEIPNAKSTKNRSKIIELGGGNWEGEGGFHGVALLKMHSNACVCVCLYVCKLHAIKFQIQLWHVSCRFHNVLQIPNTKFHFKVPSL